MVALAGYKAKIYATTTPSVAFTNEAFTDSGDHKTFTITNAAKRYWDNTAALTIQTTTDGTTWTTTTAYVAQYCGGVIILNVALVGASPGVRASGSYLPYSTVGSATSVEISHMLDILDSTSFDDGGWKTKVASLVGSEYKLSHWYIDTFFTDIITNKTRFVLSAYSGANANQRYDAFGYIKSDSLKFAVKNLNSEDISFETDGQVFATLS